MRMEFRHIIFLVVLVSALAACGSGNGGESTTETTELSATSDGEATDTLEASGDYPVENIRWVVVHDPGGGSETMVRRMQPHLEQIFGVPIEVQFRTGADGSVGWASMLEENPDGYTIATSVFPQIAVQPEAFDDAGYATEDFTYISWTETAPSTFLVPADSEFQTLEDLISATEENPGSITFSAVGNLSGSALAYGQFVSQTDVEMTYVPETGGAGGLETSLLGGHIDVAGLNVGHALRIGTDQVRALAVASDERHELLPEVPTFEELGYDVNASVMWGVIGPPDMPEELTNYLSESIQEVSEIDEFRQSLLDEGLVPIASSPEESESIIQDQKAAVEDILPIMEELD